MSHLFKPGLPATWLHQVSDATVTEPVLLQKIKSRRSSLCSLWCTALATPFIVWSYKTALQQKAFRPWCFFTFCHIAAWCFKVTFQFQNVQVFPIFLSHLQDASAPRSESSWTHIYTHTLAYAADNAYESRDQPLSWPDTSPHRISGAQPCWPPGSGIYWVYHSPKKKKKNLKYSFNLFL